MSSHWRDIYDKSNYVKLSWRWQVVMYTAEKNVHTHFETEENIFYFYLKILTNTFVTTTFHLAWFDEVFSIRLSSHTTNDFVVSQGWNWWGRWRWNPFVLTIRMVLVWENQMIIQRFGLLGTLTAKMNKKKVGGGDREEYNLF